MHTHKTLRLFLASLLLASISFSSLALPSVQAETSSSVILSPAIISKLDVFFGKVKALHSRYPSDTDWNTFLTNLNAKISALKPKYTGNALILAVLDRLTVGVNGMKVQGNTNVSSTAPDNIDLCAQQGLDNIDETNFDPDKHVFDTKMRFLGLTYDFRNFAYKMGPGQSYSFPIDTNDISNLTGRGYSSSYLFLQYNSYISSPTNIFNISERKCDFIKMENNCFTVWWKDNVTEGRNIVVNAKFSDPNYMPSVSESGKCQLLPNKKYYVNIRWLRKSDIIDASGKLRDDFMPLFGLPSSLMSAQPDAKNYWRERFLVSLFGEDLAYLSTTDLNKKLDERFNARGDSCLSPTQCLIDPFNNPQNYIIPMPKLSPQWMQAKAAAETAAHQVIIQNQEEATRQREAQCKLVGHYPNGNPCQ